MYVHLPGMDEFHTSKEERVEPSEKRLGKLVISKRSEEQETELS